MRDFVYHAPTEVHFGRGAELQVGEVLSGYGAKNVLIHFGGGSAKRSGLLDRVENSLREHGIEFTEFGGVSPNPKVQLVREGVSICREKKIDFILAVGGGSVIDSSKSMALSYANDMDPWDIVTGKAVPQKCTPLGTVLTISAAGSEMSCSHVISDLTIPMKKGLNCELVRPLFSFMDPELTFSVSKYQTGCGIVDIMMHTLERYFTGDRDTVLTDRIAEALLLTVKEAGKIAIEEPENYNARADIMWASSLSHNGLTSCGKNFKIMLAHQIEHGISAVFDNVAHGAGLAVVYPAWSKFIYKHDIERFYRIAVNVWGVEPNPENKEETALAGIRAMKEYFRSIGMPVSLHELNISPEYYETIADNITQNGKRKLKSYVELTRDDFIRILKMTDEEI